MVQKIKTFNCCKTEIQLFRRYLKDMTASGLEKKSNIDMLEKEIGLQRFFPKSILSDHKVMP